MLAQQLMQLAAMRCFLLLACCAAGECKECECEEEEEEECEDCMSGTACCVLGMHAALQLPALPPAAAHPAAALSCLPAHALLLPVASLVPAGKCEEKEEEEEEEVGSSSRAARPSTWLAQQQHVAVHLPAWQCAPACLLLLLFHQEEEDEEEKKKKVIKIVKLPKFFHFG